MALKDMSLSAEGGYVEMGQDVLEFPRFFMTLFSDRRLLGTHGDLTFTLS